VLELPADHRRPQQQGYQGGMLAFALGDELSAGLRELSRQEQVTLPVTLTAAFATLLHRYTGQEDLLVGLTVSARDRARAGRAVGCFLNTVVLRADLTGEPSVAELLGRTGAAMQQARRHQDAPFDAVVRELQPDRSLSYQPLVQVLLTFEPPQPPAPAGWAVTQRDIRTRMSKFDLGLEVDERAQELTGRLVYSSDLFEPETVSRMIGHWRMVLQAMVAEPSRPAGELRLLGDQEARQLLGEWSAGGEVRSGPGVEELIGQQARARPESVAVVCGAEQLTYRQLNGRANQLARYLRERGVTAEVPVGVCLERSLDQVIALVGILKAGGAYVPLDPAAPGERIQYVLQDLQMPLLLTQQRLQGKAGSARAEVVSLDREWRVIGQQSEEEPEPQQPAAAQLAYVIYTSGSTGQPKGVMVERGVLAAHCRAITDAYGLGRDDRVMQFSQYSFDASLEQILPTLAAGGRLIMRGPEIWSPRQLLAELSSQQVTVMNLTPAYWQQVLRAWARAPQGLAATQLRLVIIGGDRLGAREVAQWRELGLTGVRLLNAYGPTETTITATLGEAGEERERITIGRPVAGRRVYILDRRGQQVPAGVVGELHIGGPLLARGYVNQPELSRQRFVADPFAAPGGGRLYRTGDRARYLGDGRIEYVGREDQQVKIRGYRVELGEVEAALAQHPGVEEAVVVSQGESGANELVAYVVPRTAGPLAEELRSYLQDKLPAYLQPAVIAQLERLPRLATGKPDRRSLPAVERGSRRGKDGYRAPRLLTQQQLVQIWEGLLAARPIGIRDNFFDLGGHSLLAVQLVDRIEQVTGTRLGLSTLFAKPTVEQLAEALQRGDEGAEGPARVLPVQAGGRRRPFFFLHGDWTGGAFYCFALARACGPEQPFYVLEPYTFSGQDGAPTLEAIAGAHIEAMRGVQARGPYRLGGFCNGGLLAYEMARQLERAGDQVEFLGLISPSEPIQSSALRAACEGVGRVTGASGRTPARADLFLRARHAQRHVYRRLRPGGHRVQDFGKLAAIEPRLEAMFPSREALYQDYVGVFNWAVAGYKTGPYGGRITFYWAREEPAIAESWQPVIRAKAPADCAEHLVAGDLMSSVTDHIGGVAESLSEGLSRAEQEASRSQPDERASRPRVHAGR
jgi:amino acid adenylation domain-containing protein